MIYLIGAVVLAGILPSALTLPTSGPPTLAEYAPVTGEGDGSGAMSGLGAASSSGLGFGARGARTDDPVGPDPSSGRSLIKPGTKRCVGTPPRQTEDPLSPPCIAFYEGDNGGATARGVTRDEVAVVAHVDNIAGDPNRGRAFSCSEPAAQEDAFPERLCKAYQNFFNSRYQTYGRTVRLHTHHSMTPEEVEGRYKPFAHIGFSNPSAEFARRGILSSGFEGSTRASYQSLAPLMNSFRPDLEDMVQITASYICLKLDGGRAVHAGDPLMKDSPRVFGHWASQESRLSHKMLMAELESQCGIVPRETAAGTADRTGASRMKQRGVTTVILTLTGDVPASITRQSTASGFFPEWVVIGSQAQRGQDSNYNGRLADPAQWANAFGMTFDYRRSGYHEQAWYQAYREGCPQCPEPRAGDQGVEKASAIYDSIAMLFYGVQAAGPRLTHSNVDKGYHSIPPRRSDDPFLPAAYFAPGNYSYIKDATAIWWDPQGRAPETAASGCYRLANGGIRYRAGEWKAGDGDIKADGPCQGDAFPIS